MCLCNKTGPCAPGRILDSRMESDAQNCRFCDVRNAHRIILSVHPSSDKAVDLVKLRRQLQ